MMGEQHVEFNRRDAEAQRRSLLEPIGISLRLRVSAVEKYFLQDLLENDSSVRI
jgi:hypothetical protein